MYVTSCLHVARICVCSPDSPFSLKSTFVLSAHFRFSLPFLLPSTSILVTLFSTYSSSLLMTNLLSCIFLDISPTFVVPLILSFLILSVFVTPHIHLNILISNFFSRAFFAAHVSAPYKSAPNQNHEPYVFFHSYVLGFLRVKIAVQTWLGSFQMLGAPT